MTNRQAPWPPLFSLLVILLGALPALAFPPYLIPNIDSMDSQNVPVFTMPRMRTFLSKNGPWDQLINRGNIKINDIHADQPVTLFPEVRVTPIIVPHRDEYSETVGYIIEGPGKMKRDSTLSGKASDLNSEIGVTIFHYNLEAYFQD